MNCEQCEDQLLELLYGELSAPQAALVQSHANDCETCASALHELEDAVGFANAFSYEEPPASFDTPIMEAARSHVLREERLAHVTTPSQAEAVDEGDTAPGLLAWIRGLMSGPQLLATGAMIAVLGVSIWMLRAKTVQNDTAMQVHPMEAPFSEVDPMAPQPKETPKGGEQAPFAIDDFDVENVREQGERQEDAMDFESRDMGARKERLRRRAAPARSSARVANQLEKSAYPMEELRTSRGYSASVESKKAAAPAAPSVASRTMQTSAESALGGAGLTDTKPKAEAEADEASARSDDREITTAYNRGINYYEAGRYAEAARSFEQALSSKDARRSDTLFYLARSYRERGDCARAIAPYQAFVRENPKDARANSAQNELRDCQARVSKANKGDAAKRSKAVSGPSAL